MRETKGLEKKRQRVSKSEREKEGEQARLAGEGGELHSPKGVSRQQGPPERENSGRTQGSRDRQYLLEMLGQPEGWVRWHRQPLELRAVPRFCPPALHLVPTNTDIDCIPDP